MTRTSTPTTDSTIRIGGPSDLLDAIPYLLGFHPERSLVLVGLDDQRLVVTIRVDLDDLADGDLLHETLAAMHRGGARSAIAALYDDAPDLPPLVTGQWVAVLDQLHACTDAEQVMLLDVLAVNSHRWRSLLCEDRRCCPERGRELRLGTSAFSAEATYAGMAALPSRQALQASLEPVSPEERMALDPLISDYEGSYAQALTAASGAHHDRSVKRAIFAAARAADDPENAASPSYLSRREVARFGAALSRYPIRDALWMAIDDGRLDGRTLWRDLARRLPSPYDAAPLFLLGWRSWRAGDGATANIAVERAINSDPRYSAADLLAAALSRGLDPRSFPKVRPPRSR